MTGPVCASRDPPTIEAMKVDEPEPSCVRDDFSRIDTAAKYAPESGCPWEDAS